VAVVSLRELFAKHRCDKGFRHDYGRFYEPRFRDHKDQPLRFLEIGIYKGASIKAWLEYFPQAHVIAVDTFQRIAAKDVPILNHPRVTWHQCDSTKEAPRIDLVDFIIDDGCHSAKAQLQTFNNYYPLLKDDGVYFIEDVKDFAEFGSLPPCQHHDMGRHDDSKIIEIPS
jgi:spermidine synthase